MAFYSGLDCSGNYTQVLGRNGELDLTATMMDNVISSFMVWESGMYPTRRLIDECPDKKRRA